MLGAIAERREVGNETDEPEERGHRSVGGHGEHVPNQRAPEVRPESHRVRIREEPVDRQPGPAGVDEWEQRRAGHGEERHRFREPVDRRAPVLFEEQEDRRGGANHLAKLPTWTLTIGNSPESIGQGKAEG